MLPGWSRNPGGLVEVEGWEWGQTPGKPVHLWLSRLRDICMVSHIICIRWNLFLNFSFFRRFIMMQITQENFSSVFTVIVSLFSIPFSIHHWASVVCVCVCIWVPGPVLGWRNRNVFFTVLEAGCLRSRLSSAGLQTAVFLLHLHTEEGRDRKQSLSQLLKGTNPIHEAPSSRLHLILTTS